MAIIKEKIEGIEVEYASTLRPHVGEYGVYQNKIWRATASYGSGKDFRIILERPIAGEKVTLKTDEYKNVRLLGKPKGYIHL